MNEPESLRQMVKTSLCLANVMPDLSDSNNPCNEAYYACSVLGRTDIYIDEYQRMEHEMEGWN